MTTRVPVALAFSHSLPAGIVFLRHGESKDVALGLVSGWRNSPLTETGRWQASQVARRISPLGIRRVVCSDLLRARETALILCEELGLPPPTMNEQWRERGWGSKEGLPHGSTEEPADAEPIRQFCDRLVLAARTLEPGDLIVTHAGPIRVFKKHWNERKGVDSPPCGIWRPKSAPAPSPKVFVGHVFTPGKFSGKATYITSVDDLAKAGPESLILLNGCDKAVAVQALNIGKAAINLTRSLTQHVNLGRPTVQPYAVALKWPEGYPAEGARVYLQPKKGLPPPARPHLPDPRPRTAAVTIAGGKVAGLRLLDASGFAVPRFLVLSWRQLQKWEDSGIFAQRVALWVRRRLADSGPNARWAVRSSADVEDSEQDPHSGTFSSRLDVLAGDLPAAIEHVWRDAKNPEVALRLESGRLAEWPKLSVAVQEMVRRPRLSGAVFLPAPDDPTAFLIEAQMGRNSEGLMDGTEHPSLQARFDRHGKPLGTPDADPLGRKERRALREIARQGLAIFLHTGRGDLEFAMDGAGKIWWLQARMLNIPVESVDRRGFHPKATFYYKSLAFFVNAANLTPRVWFRCFDLPDGRFGYSGGIRERDHEFHLAIKKDIGHLAEVTRFGWNVERRMAEVCRSLSGSAPGAVMKLLILHGAVQLPFSIPMDEHRMDRFRSFSLERPKPGGLLEEFLNSLLPASGLRTGVSEIRDLLLTPPRTLSTLHALRNRIRAAIAPGEPSDRLILESLIPDLRNIPPPPGPDLPLLLQPARDRASTDRQEKNLKHLREETETVEAAWKEKQKRREELIRCLEQELRPVLFRKLRLWAEYLEMKAETNETHSLYRGTCFAWFASNRRSPRQSTKQGASGGM